MLLSETPYLLISTVALFFLLRDRDKRGGRFPWAGLLLGVAAAHVRTIGIALGPAGALDLLFRRRYRQAAYFILAFGLLLLPWNERNRRAAAEGEPYLSNFFRVNEYRSELGRIGPSELLERIKNNLKIYCLDVPETVIGNVTNHNLYSVIARRAGNTPVYLIHYLLLFLILYGFGLKLIRGPTAMEWYMTIYMAILLLWPDLWSGPRFLVPVAPLIAGYFIVALGNIQSRVRRIGKSKVVVVAITAVLIAANLMSLGWGSNPYPAAWENYFEAARWSRSNMRPGSAVACRKPFLFHLVSGHRTVNYPFSPDPGVVVRGMIADGAGYLVVDSLGFSTFRLYLAPTLQTYMKLFKPVYILQEPRTIILSIETAKFNKLK